MIYLVLNVEENEDPFVLDICSDKETANMLRGVYIRNFIKNNLSSIEEAKNIIIVKEVDTNTGNNVFWTAYPEDKETGITYNIN